MKLLSRMCLVLCCILSFGGMGKEYALVGGMLLDGYEAPPVHYAVVVIKDNRIHAAGAAHEVEVPEGIPVIDTRGKTILPGLIDLHIHLDLIGHGDYNRYYQFIGGTKRLNEVMPIAAKQMLMAGVTTAVDLGSPFHILDVRNKIREQKIPGPRLLVSGPWITRIKLNGVPDEYQLVINSPEQAAEKTRWLIENGADVIKVWLGLTLEDYRAVVKIAHQHGVKVHAHLYKVQAINNALDAGIDVLQHVGSAKMPPYPEYLVRRIAESRVPVVQTISHRIWIYPASVENPGRLDNAELERSMSAEVYRELQHSFKHFRSLSYFRNVADEIRLSKVNARQFIDANAYIGVGTDAASPLNFHTEAMWREMSALVDSGMTPIRVISAATKTNAEIIGKSDELGTIEAGKLADIVVVDGNPLFDINMLKNVRYTIKNGQVWTKRVTESKGSESLVRFY